MALINISQLGAKKAERKACGRQSEQFLYLCVVATNSASRNNLRDRKHALLTMPIYGAVETLLVPELFLDVPLTSYGPGFSRTPQYPCTTLLIYLTVEGLLGHK